MSGSPGLARPSVADLREVAQVFTGLGSPDRTWLRFLAVTAPAVDLAVPEHRDELFAWLNSWGCRIRKPRPGEPTPFQDGVAAWWDEWAARLPEVALHRLTDGQAEEFGRAYAALAALPVTHGRVVRTLGPTAAAKTLYALRPAAAMPWDAAIATTLYGARDGAAFARHLRMGRAWALAVLAEAGTGEAELTRAVGRAGISLAKVLDEYCYVRITYAN